MSGVASLPACPGMDEFRGTQMHSSRFGSGEDWKGRKTVVVLGGLCSERAVKNGIDVAAADLVFASLPHEALPPLQLPVHQQMKERDADFHQPPE